MACKKVTFDRLQNINIYFVYTAITLNPDAQSGRRSPFQTCPKKLEGLQKNHIWKKTIFVGKKVKNIVLFCNRTASLVTSKFIEGSDASSSPKSLSSCCNIRYCSVGKIMKVKIWVTKPNKNANLQASSFSLHVELTQSINSSFVTSDVDSLRLTIAPLRVCLYLCLGFNLIWIISQVAYCRPYIALNTVMKVYISTGRVAFKPSYRSAKETKLNKRDDRTIGGALSRTFCCVLCLATEGDTISLCRLLPIIHVRYNIMCAQSKDGVNICIDF